MKCDMDILNDAFKAIMNKYDSSVIREQADLLHDMADYLKLMAYEKEKWEQKQQKKKGLNRS